MLKEQPQREPNLTISDLRIDADFDDRIFYTLAYDKHLPKAEHEWVIPEGSNFNPPAYMQEGESYAVWSEDIKVTKVNVKGKKTSKTRQDWCWILPLSDHEKQSATLTPLAKKVMTQKARDQLVEIKDKVAQFESLFERLTNE